MTNLFWEDDAATLYIIMMARGNHCSPVLAFVALKATRFVLISVKLHS